MMDRRSLRRALRKKRDNRPAPCRPLRLEALEPRQLLAAGIWINNATAVEGDPANFTVSLTQPAPYPVSVDFSTFDDSAVAPDDYQPASSQLQFAPGQTHLTLAIQTLSDQAVDEQQEQFHLILSNAQPAEVPILDGLGVGTIIEDSSQIERPTVSVSAVQHASENGDKGQLRFTRDTTVGWLQVGCTIDESSTASPNDYTQPTTPLTVVFADGQSETRVDVLAVDDQEPELAETLIIRIQESSQYEIGQETATVMIQDNDQSGGGGDPAPARVSIEATHDASEDGEIGLFTFQRDDVSHFMKVFYVVDQQESTATAGLDYISPHVSDFVSFLPGQPRATVDLVALDDTLIEGTETVIVKIVPSSEYEISGDAAATGKIRDNDVPPVSMSDIAINRFYADGRHLLVDYSITGTGVPPFSIGVYYSDDGQQIDPDQRLLLHVAESVYPGSHTAVIDPRFSDMPRDYYLVAKVDDQNQVRERSESNNQLVFEGGVFVDRDQVVHVHGGDDFAGDLVQVRHPDDLAVSLAYTPRPLPSLPAPGTTPPPFPDVSGDHSVSLADYTLLASQLRPHRPHRQNSDDIFDVNGDGAVTPLDALLVLNDVRSNGVRRVPVGSTGSPFLDVSGDNILSWSDSDLITSYLNSPSPNLWTNADNRFDTNQDGQVDATDAQVVRDSLADGGVSYHYPYGQITEVHVRTHKGDDLVDFGPLVDKWTWIFGGKGNDRLLGSSGHNQIEGSEGCDHLEGRSGDDALRGGDGEDVLVGGEGDDFLRGDEALDLFDAGLGFDDPEIVDNGQAGFSTRGAWSTREAAAFNQNEMLPDPTDSLAMAEWTFQVPQSGWYDVYTTWHTSEFNAGPAIYTIWNGTAEHFGQVLVDQTAPPSGIQVEDTRWHKMGTFEVNQSYLLVQLNGQFGPPPSADAVMIAAGEQPQNQSPRNLVPSTQQVPENGILTFSASQKNQVQIEDPDAGDLPIAVTISAESGTLSLNGTAGLTFLVGDGQADSTMTFVGPQRKINAAFEQMTYAPPPDFHGSTDVHVLTNDQGHRGSGGPQTDSDKFEVVTIADHENWTVAIEAIDPIAAETGAGELADYGTFRVSRSPADDEILDLGIPLTVDLGIAGTATDGEDYQKLADVGNFLQVIIPPGRTSIDFHIKPINDPLREPQSETVRVGISPRDDFYQIGVPSQATVELHDNDRWDVTISATDDASAETADGAVPDQGTLRITRRNSTDFSYPLRVDYEVKGTATSHADFLPLAGSAEIPAGAAFVDVSITPRNDGLRELELETARLDLIDKSNLLHQQHAYRAVPFEDTAQVTIRDNDQWTVTTHAITPRVDESAEQTGRFLITRDNGGDNDTTFPLAVLYQIAPVFGAATNGLDYTYLSGVATIPAGSLATEVQVVPRNDALREPDEVVQLQLIAQEERNRPGYQLGDRNSAALTIVDNDHWHVAVEVVQPLASEAGQGRGVLAITRQNETDVSWPLTVSFSTSGTAAGNGQDYQELGDNVTIPAGEFHTLLEIVPVDDQLPEPLESVTVDLQQPSSEASYIIDTPGSATVWIQDHDARVKITSETRSLFESSPNPPALAQFELLDGPLPFDLTIAYESAGSATGGMDYQQLPPSVILPAGHTTISVPIIPLDDDEIEGDESITIQLEEQSSYRVDGNRQVSWTIEDDDRASYTTTLCWCDFVEFVEQTGASVVQALGGLLNHFSTLNPHPVLTVDVALSDRTLAATHIEAQARLGSEDEFIGPVVVFTTDQLTEQSLLEPFRFALQTDASHLPTGQHPWSITVTEYYEDQDPVSRTYHGRQLVQNRTESSFGRRWAFAAWDKLVVQSDGAGIVKGNGNFVWFSLQPDNSYQLDSGDGQTVRLTRAANRFVAENRDGSTSTFDETGRLLTTTDRHHQSNTFHYTDANADGRQDELLQLVDEVGRATTFTYTNGLVTAITDFAGRTTSLEYSQDRQLVRVTYPDPDGPGPLEPAASTYAYDAESGLMHEATAEDGSVTAYQYDASGALVARTLPNDAVEYFQAVVTVGLANPDANEGTRDNPMPLTHVTDVTGYRRDAQGRTVQFRTDQQGLRIWQRDAEGNEVAMDRAEDGQIVQKQETHLADTDVWETHYEYDERGNRTLELLPDGSTRSWTYDAWNQVTSFTNELGQKTLYRHDPDTGDLLEVRLVVGEIDDRQNGETDDSVQRYTYTGYPESPQDAPAGLIASFTDAASHLSTYQYNMRGLLVEVIHAVGTDDEALEQYTYDDADNLISYLDELGRTTDYEYDILGRLTKLSLPDPDGSGPAERPVIRHEYDSRNRRTRTTDPLGRVTSYEYDSAGNLTRVIEPDHDGDGIATVSEFTYDDGNRLIDATDPLGHRTEYAYDALDRVRQITLPLVDPSQDRGTSYVYTYNHTSQLASVTDPLHNTTFFDYDPTGRRKTTTLADPDGAGPQSSPQTVAEYDAAGNLVREVDPLGNETRYEYNELNQVARILQPQPDGDSHVELAATFTYDRVGNLSTSTDARGATTGYAYDARNRLISVTQPHPADGSATGPTTQFAYDAAGQLISETDALGRTTFFRYDNLGRTTAVKYPKSSVEHTDGMTVQNFYDAVGNLTRVIQDAEDVDQNGIRPETQYVYDAHNNRVATVMPDPDGDGPLSSPVQQYVYDSLGQLVEVIDSLSRRTSFTFDALGRVADITYPWLGYAGQNEAVEHFRYDAVGNTVQAIDALGNVSDFAYDSLNRLIRVADAAPSRDELAVRPVSSYVFDAASRVVSAIDPLGNTTNFEYDNLNRLVRSIDPALANGGHRQTSFEYDAAGNQTAMIDSAGFRTEVEYDFLSRPTRIRQPDPDGNGPEPAPAKLMAYDDLDHLRSETDPLGRTTEYEYDELGRLTHVRQPPASPGSTRPVTQTSFDALGNPIRETDPLGNATLFQFDALSQLIEVRQPNPLTGAAGAGPATSFSYDAAGQLASIVDPLGRVTRFSYNAMGNRMRATVNGEIQTSWDYDANGNLVREVDALGNETHFAYDGLDRLTSTVRPDPGDGSGTTSESQTYDLASRVVATRDSMDHVTRYTFDALGRPTQTIYPDPDGNGTQLPLIRTLVYDLQDNVVEEFDSQGHRVVRIFDPLGRLVSSTVDNASGQEITRWAYDAVGNRRKQIDPLGNITTWTYDNLDQVLRETDARGNSRSYAYDLSGNMVQQTDRNQRTIRFDYDHLHRLTAEHWQQSSQNDRTLSYEFDDGNRLTSAVDPSAGIVFAYDAMNRVTEIQHVYAELVTPIDVQQSYDEVGNRLRMEMAVGSTPSLTPRTDFVNEYTYDNLYRLTSVVQSAAPESAAASEKRVQFGYDSADKPIRIERFADGAGEVPVAHSTLDYSPAAKLTHMAHFAGELLAEYHWSYDAAGRLTNAVSSIDGATSFSYDRRDQLTGAERADRTDSYAYDANGNRSGDGYVTETGNRIASDGTYEYEYDNEGNRIRRVHLDNGTITEYGWDHRNRLISVVEREADQTHVGFSVPGQTTRIEYTYDLFDRRISQRVVDTNNMDGETHFFVYDGQQLALRLDESGTVVNRYLHGPAVDQVLADEQFDPQTGQSQVLWPLTDRQGSVGDLATYDTETAITSIANHISYDAFGNVLSETDAAVEHLFGFADRPLDQETGLYFNRARYFDPAVGRFLSEDPLGFQAGDTNLYRYAGNSPTNLTDPSGLAPPADEALLLLQGFLNRNRGQHNLSGLSGHPHYVPAANAPGGGFVATNPRYRNGRVVGSQASPDWELVRRQREVERRERVRVEAAQRQVMGRALNRALQRAQQGTVSFLCEDGSTGQMSRNIDPRVAQQLLSAPDGRRVVPASMHFLGDPFRNGPESLLPSEQELEDRTLHEVGRIQVEAVGPLAWTKTLFDLLGLIPGAEPFDVLSGSISAFEGNYGEAMLSAAAIVPLGGQLTGMSKIADRFRSTGAVFGDLWRSSDKFRDFMAGAGDLLRRHRENRNNKIVTVFRGMTNEEFDAVSATRQLICQAELTGEIPASPSLLQRWAWHSLNSKYPPSPYASVAGSPRVARHFVLEDMHHGFRGAIDDLLIAVGVKTPVIADGKTVAKITMRRGDLFRTLHIGQDELIALTRSGIRSISQLDPAQAGRLSYRVFLGGTGQAGVSGTTLGLLAYPSTYFWTYFTFRAYYELTE